MAESRGAKSAIAREKIDLARDKFDFDQTYKAAENERKIQESAMRVQAAEARSTIAEKQLGLQTKAQELRDLQNEMRLQDAERATQDKIGFLKATRDLKEDAEDFDVRMADAMAQFPNANKDEMIQKRVGWMLDSRKDYLERTRAKPKQEATITTTEDENGKVTTSIRKPFTQAEADAVVQKREREKLENQHSMLEGELQSKKSLFGNPDPAVLSKLNEVKQKLGYTILDSAGKPVAKVAETVTSEIPTLTEKPQFDALPSGAKYIRNGVTYQKP